MAVNLTNEQELYRQIRNKDIRPCYFFYGKDVATLESVVKKLVSRLVPEEARDLNYHFFPADGFDLSEFCDVCESLPVFCDRVVAAVNDLNAESLRADDFKQLQSAVSGLDPETVTVIFYATGTDLCGGKKSLTEKNRKLCETVQKVGGVAVEFAYKRAQDLVKYVTSRVEKGGSTVDADAAKMIAEACLCNILMINNEIDKLCAYRHGENITIRDVNELVAGQLDTDAYKLAKAVTLEKRGEVFAILSELYSRQQESVALLSVIGSAFLDLYRAKLALMNGRSEQDILRDFPYKGREFAARNALRDCTKIRIEKLRTCLEILAECDADMKSKRTDNRILLDEAVTRMMNG